MVISSPAVVPPVNASTRKDGEGYVDLVDQFRRAVASLVSDKLEFEETASIISDPAVLKATDIFLAGTLHKQAKIRISSRVLLSAFMIVKHPEVLNCESHDIRKHSESILGLLSDLFQNPSEESRETFADAFAGFLVSFDQWKREDAVALKKDLQRELDSAESLREALLKESKEAQAEWIPRLNGLKSQVSSLLDKLSRLKTNSILAEKEEQPSNVQIAHDLFIEGPAKFDYFSLYMPSHQDLLMRRVALLKGSPSSETIYEAIGSVKKSLLGLVQGGGQAYELIEEGLDLCLVKSSVQSGQYHDLLQFIIGMMAELCAPIRDPQIEELRQILLHSPSLSLPRIVELASLLCSDKIMFDIAKVMPNLPGLIVQYERDEFAHAYSAIPLTEAACKKVYKYPGMEAGVLAAELFTMALSSQYFEILWLDRKRVVSFIEEVDRISFLVAGRLTNKKSVPSDDPTFVLIKKRTIEYLRQSILPSTSMNAPRVDRIDANMASNEQDALGSLASKVVALFQFHFKVYQPVYAHLAKNFQ